MTSDNEESALSLQPTSKGFCTPQNISSALDYINHILASHGYPSPLTLIHAEQDDAAKTVNCLLALLQKRQKESDLREDLDSRYQKLNNDYTRTSSLLEKTASKLEGSERELLYVRQKLHSSTGAYTTLTKALNDTKDELKSTKSQVSVIKASYKHDVRKRDLELQKVKDRLQKVLSEKNRCTTVAFDLINPLATFAVARSKEQTMTNMDNKVTMIAELEEREKDHVIENLLLRKLLFVCTERIKLISENIQDVPSLDAQFACFNEKLGTDHDLARYNLPTELSSADLEATFLEAMEEMQLKALRMHRAMEDAQDELKIKDQELRAAILRSDEMSKVLIEQSRLIELSLSDNCEKKNPRSEDLRDLERELTQKLLELEQKQSKLDAERAKFTEAAIRLGRERASLQLEKAQWAEKQRELDTQIVLKDFPATPTWLKEGRSWRSPNHSRSPTPNISKVSMSHSPLAGHLGRVNGGVKSRLRIDEETVREERAHKENSPSNI